ncbi:MAG: flagellar biosynthesis protein FlhA, partial [Novosphingobium sp.]
PAPAGLDPDLPAASAALAAALVAKRGPGGAPLALVVQPRARRALAALLRPRAPSVLVLSIAELPAAQPIEVVSVIGSAEPPLPTQISDQTERAVA